MQPTHETERVLLQESPPPHETSLLHLTINTTNNIHSTVIGLIEFCFWRLMSHIMVFTNRDFDMSNQEWSQKEPPLRWQVRPQLPFRIVPGTVQ
jgi:hypothetical protein